MITEFVFTLKCKPYLTFIEDKTINFNCIHTVLFDFISVIDPPVVVSQTNRKITCGNWFLPVGVCDKVWKLVPYSWRLWENVWQLVPSCCPVGVCEGMCGNWFLPDFKSEYVRECVENGSYLLFCWSLWKNVRQLVATCWSLWGNVWQLVSSRMSLWENVFDCSGTTKLRTESAAQQSGYTRQHCPSQVLLSRFCQGLYNRYVVATGLILQYISVHQRR